MIFVIDDDEIMRECITRACGDKSKIQDFSNAIEAMDAINETNVPQLIFLDILLDGPDGFTLLHELISYDDTAKIPIVIISSLDLQNYDLSAYGVVGVLAKDQMKPQDIKRYVQKYTQ